MISFQFEVIGPGLMATAVLNDHALISQRVDLTFVCGGVLLTNNFSLPILLFRPGDHGLVVLSRLTF